MFGVAFDQRGNQFAGSSDGFFDCGGSGDSDFAPSLSDDLAGYLTGKRGNQFDTLAVNAECVFRLRR